jgi:hypothetical protein
MKSSSLIDKTKPEQMLQGKKGEHALQSLVSCCESPDCSVFAVSFMQSSSAQQGRTADNNI